jgi:hypothetical protein
MDAKFKRGATFFFDTICLVAWSFLLLQPSFCNHLAAHAFQPIHGLHVSQGSSVRISSWPSPSSTVDESEATPVIVVGKIIVDEYGPPDATSPTTMTVGGGGPQAAMGAALALAALQYLNQEHLERLPLSDSSPPPPQPVMLLGAVGDLDFGDKEEQQLQETFQGALQQPPVLVRGKECVTPRIRLWHEGDDQILKWYAIENSFGDERGAGKLWKTVPSVKDYQQVIEQCTLLTTTKPILHVICEGGVAAPGKNGDSAPLLDPNVRQSISCLSVEPILFPQDGDGKVSQEDVANCMDLLQKILDGNKDDDDNKKWKNLTIPFIVSPDKAAYQAMEESKHLPLIAASSSTFCFDSWAIREGPKGSTIISASTEVSMSVPAAKLRELVNPTGAGNAYSAAYSALRGLGCDLETCASIATGVGAVFCEYNHCPPYTYPVIERILQARDEVLEQMAVHGTWNYSNVTSM